MSHIYKIQNKINGNFYIGSSDNVFKRFNTHKRELKNNKHHCIPLQRAYNKYGLENFDFIILEECINVNKLEREQYYLDNLNPIYNISKNSEAPMQGRKHSKSTIEKFKNIKRKSGEEHYSFDKKQTQKNKAARLKSRLESGYKHSENTKLKMSETGKKLNRYTSLIDSIERQKIKVISSDGNLFDSLMDTAKFYKISVQAVCDNLKGRSKKTRVGVTFKYAKNT